MCVSNFTAHRLRKRSKPPGKILKKSRVIQENLLSLDIALLKIPGRNDMNWLAGTLHVPRISAQPLLRLFINPILTALTSSNRKLCRQLMFRYFFRYWGKYYKVCLNCFIVKNIGFNLSCLYQPYVIVFHLWNWIVCDCANLFEIEPWWSKLIFFLIVISAWTHLFRGWEAAIMICAVVIVIMVTRTHAHAHALALAHAH